MKKLQFYFCRGRRLIECRVHTGNLPDIVLAGGEGTLHLWLQALFRLLPGRTTLLPQLISYVPRYSLQDKLVGHRWKESASDNLTKSARVTLEEMQEFLTAFLRDTRGRAAQRMGAGIWRLCAGL